MEKVSVKRSDALNTDKVMPREASGLNGDKANPEIASWFGAIRSVSDTVAVSQPANRGTKAVGDPCGCDSECANLTSNGGCVIGQCVRQG
ncbi:MAG: hypothetical protein JSU63_08780, partial [Phycisphaerales bacterium]